jgi:hypothetical protein
LVSSSILSTPEKKIREKLDGKIPKSGGPQKFVWGGRWDEFWKNAQAETSGLRLG